jgi:putative tRNA adenosine deaminase-associated protein
MSYFTAVLTRADDSFQLVDLVLEDVEDLAVLADLVDGVGDGSADGEAVAVIEHEDEWFGLIRIVEGDATVFLSDVSAAAASPYADLLADYLDSRTDEYEEDEEPADEQDEGAEDDDEEADEDAQMLDLDQSSEWGGDPGLFADAGVSAEELLAQLERHGADPARVVAHVGEAAGFADALEAAR